MSQSKPQAQPSQAQPDAGGTEGIDKQALYGRYQAAEDRRAKLASKMYHKALDIPEEDDVNINVDKSTRSGIGWKELAVGVLGLAATGCFGLAAYDRLEPKPLPAQQPPAETQPADHRDNIGLFEMDISGG